MKTFVILLAFCGVLSAQEAKAKPADSKVRVIVFFENISSVKGVSDVSPKQSPSPKGAASPDNVSPSRQDKYADKARALIEDMMTSLKGVTVLERSRLDTLHQEMEFNDKSGLVDPEKAVKIGKLLGANMVVMGTIIDVNTSESEFTGYGIHVKGVKLTASVRLRVIDVEKGVIPLSKVMKGVTTTSSSGFGSVSNSDVIYQTIEIALDKFKDDDAFLSAMAGTRKAVADGRVKLHIEPAPANCDVEIDGVFVGNSPLNWEAVAGDVIKISISKAGFLPWTKNVKASDSNITPELDRRE